MASRLLFDLGGEIRATGALTLAGGAGAGQPATSTCSACVAAALSQGAANWVVRLVRAKGQGGSLLGTGQGASMQAGPFPLEQGELIQIEITGATVGAAVTGSVYGQQGLRPNEVPPISAVPVVTTNVNASISGNVGINGNVPVVNAAGQSLKTTQNQSQLGTFGAIPSGTSPSQNFAIDPGAHAIALLFQNIPAGAGQIVLAGVQSNSIYTTEQLADIGPGDAWVGPVFPGGDTQVNVQIQNNTGSTITGVTVVEILDVESPFIFPAPKLIKQATPSTIAQSTNWGVTLQKAAPAPWQASGQGGIVPPPVFNATIAANTDGPTLDAGTAGQTIYLRQLNIVGQATAATLPALMDTASNLFWETNLSSTVNVGPVPLDGQPVGQGNGVKLRNNGGAACTVTGSLHYSKVTS